MHRDVNLAPLLPPFMWLKSRPRSTLSKVQSDVSTIEKKIISNENHLESGKKFVHLSSKILPAARRSVNSIAKALKSNEDADKENFNKIEVPISTKDAKAFQSFNDEGLMKESRDPTVSHVLTTSYDLIPQARYYEGDGTNPEYEPVTLPKRPHSPVRHILANKFDLETSRRKLTELADKLEAMNYFDESTARMSEVIKLRLYDVSQEQYGTEMMIKVIHEEVALTSACESLGIDVAVFVDASISWAILAIATNVSEKVSLKKTNKPLRSGAFFKVKGLVDKSIGIALSSLASLRNPTLSFQCSTVHRSLAWDLLCPAHEYSRVLESYRVLVDCIDARLPGGQEDKAQVPRIPDLSCYHFYEIDPFAQRRKFELR